MTTDLDDHSRYPKAKATSERKGADPEVSEVVIKTQQVASMKQRVIEEFRAPYNLDSALLHRGYRL